MITIVINIMIRSSSPVLHPTDKSNQVLAIRLNVVSQGARRLRSHHHLDIVIIHKGHQIDIIIDMNHDIRTSWAIHDHDRHQDRRQHYYDDDSH